MPEPDLTPVSPQQKQLRMIFIGPQDIRAGWRLLVFFALVAALASAAFFCKRPSGIVPARIFPRRM